MDGLRDHLARFRDTFLSSDHSHMSVNDMWVSFKSEVIAAIERFIPTKMTKAKYSLPYLLLVTCCGVPDFVVPHACWRYLVLLQEGKGI